MTDTNQDTDAGDQDNRSDESGTDTYAPTIVGWIARIVSLALLLTIVGVIAWKASLPKEPVAFTAKIQSEDIRPNAGKFLVPVEIKNEGSETALNLVVEIDAEGETTTLEIPMIGQKESLTFVISAERPPQAISHRIVSYEAP